MENNFSQELYGFWKRRSDRLNVIHYNLIQKQNKINRNKMLTRHINAKKKLIHFNFYKSSYNIPSERIRRCMINLKVFGTSDEEVKKMNDFCKPYEEYRKKYDLNRIYNDIVYGKLQPTEQKLIDDLRKELGVKYLHSYTDGKLICIGNYGRIDPTILKRFSIEQIILFHNIILDIQIELMRRLSKKENRLVRNIVILDLNGLTIMKLANSKFVDLIKTVVDVHVRYERETSYYTMVTNVPTIFYGLWKVISPFIPKAILNDIKLVPDNGLEMLNKSFETDALPIQNGGKCDCSCCLSDDILNKVL